MIVMKFDLILEGKLDWRLLLASLVIALFVGIIVANWLFRDVSWDHMFTSKPTVSWTAKGTIWHNRFEEYIAAIFFISLFVWIVLTFCAIRYVGGFQ